MEAVEKTFLSVSLISAAELIARIYLMGKTYEFILQGCFGIKTEI